MTKFTKLFSLFTNLSLCKALLSHAFSGYLLDSGWVNSFNLKLPVNKDEEPIPWVTLPCIDFLTERLTNKLNIFEFGAGNSTFYFAKLVNSVTSVEHDECWYKKISGHSLKNVSISLCELEYDAKYCRFPSDLNTKFHLIVVDGRDRVNCVKQSLNSLAVDGCILLDDSERNSYQEARDYLNEAGFKNIDFWGVSPGLSYRKCTTIFYREHNFLNI